MELKSCPLCGNMNLFIKGDSHQEAEYLPAFIMCMLCNLKLTEVPYCHQSLEEIACL